MLESHPARILAILPAEEDRRYVNALFASSNWELRCVGSLEEAETAKAGADFAVILTEAQLPEGRGWKDVLNLAAHADNPASVIVTTRFADDALWGEVIESGGWDVLAKPFPPGELFGSASLAWRCWRDRSAAPRNAMAGH